MNGRIIGMLIAGLLAGLAIAALVVAYLTAPPPLNPQPSIGAAPVPPIVPDDEVSSIDDIANAPGEMIDTGSRWTWRSVNERGELNALVTAERFDPIRRGQYEITDVRALFYREGRIMLMTAALGEMRGQRGEEPESGVLSGGVEISLFPVGVTKEEVESYETTGEGTAPETRFVTPAMRFDTTLGELRAEESIRVTGTGYRVTGSGLTLRFGDVQGSDSQRLLLARLDRSDGLELWPDRLSQDSDAADPGREGTGEQSSVAPSPSAATDEPFTARGVDETIYRFAMEDRVAISTGPFVTRADRVLAYARVLGDKLPADAIMPIVFATSTDNRERSDNGIGVGGQPDSSMRGQGSGATRSVFVTWNGPLEIRPVLDTPGVLDFDHAVFRMVSDDDLGVSIGDDLEDVRLRAQELTYFATSGAVEVRGFGAEGVRLEAEGTGAILCGSIDIDLANSPSVSVQLPTRGRAYADAGTLGWAESARLEGSLLDGGFLARSLTVTGSVELDSLRGASASAAELGLDFDAGGAVRAITGTGGVTGIAGDQRLVARDVDLQVEQAVGGALILRSAVARGDARVEEGARVLEADEISATFARSPDARNALERVDAEGDVRIQAEGGLAITAGGMRSDRRAGITDLVGVDEGPVYVTKQEPGATLNARIASLRIEEESERVTGFGAGSGTLVSVDNAEAQYTEAGVTWGGGLVYEGASRALELIGGVSATGVVSETETHTAGGDRLELTLGEDDFGDLVVQDVLLFSGPGVDGTIRYATAEARRLVPVDAAEQREGTAGPLLESLLALRSSELRVNAVSQTVEAPGEGRLVIEDARPRSADDQMDSDAGGDDFDTRGTSMFTWQGGVAVDLNSGVASMERQIRVRHLPPDGGELTQLDCEELAATFSGSGADSGGYELVEMRAQNSVFAEYRDIEVLCDVLSFTARTQEIVATALPGNRITVHDPSNRGHFTTREVVIDLATGNWRSRGTTGSGGAP